MRESNIRMYPSRDEAMRYRRALREAVTAARKGEEPERHVPAWPAGLDRTLLASLPLPAHTRNCLRRTGLTKGDDALTVAEMLRTPEVGPTTLANLLLAVDAFLGEYIAAFEERPGPVHVAAMRLAGEVRRLTSTEAVIVDERVLRRPPSEFHTLAVRLEMSSGRIRSRVVDARHRVTIALGPELRHVAAAVKSGLGPDPSESDVTERIDTLLDEVLTSDGDAVVRRTPTPSLTCSSTTPTNST